MGKAFTALLFLLSVLTGAFALLTQATEMAGEAPGRYQPLFIDGLAASLVSAWTAAGFFVRTGSRWRYLSLVPGALCALTWYGLARMAPYAFG